MTSSEKYSLENKIVHYLETLERLETKFDRTLPVIKGCTEYYIKQINKCLEELNAE